MRVCDSLLHLLQRRCLLHDNGGPVRAATPVVLCPAPVRPCCEFRRCWSRCWLGPRTLPLLLCLERKQCPNWRFANARNAPWMTRDGAQKEATVYRPALRSRWGSEHLSVHAPSRARCSLSLSLSPSRFSSACVRSCAAFTDAPSFFHRTSTSTSARPSSFLRSLSAHVPTHPHQVHDVLDQALCSRPPRPRGVLPGCACRFSEAKRARRAEAEREVRDPLRGLVVQWCAFLPAFHPSQLRFPLSTSITRASSPVCT